MKLRNLLIILFITVYSGRLLSQVKKGCTDPYAKNYDSTAVVNDGSCNYKLTIYNPKLVAFLPGEVDETSGLIFFNGGLWTMNDSGGKPALYKIDTVTGKVLQRVTIENATNRDWEDLAADDKYVYIGDFGNNSGNRNDLKIYKVKKSDFPEKGDGKVKANIIEFEFVDRGKEKIKSRNENNFDCEALTVIGDSLYLFSKDWKDQKTRLYVLPKKPGKYIAQLRGSFNTKGLVTAADYNPGLNELVLQGYKNRSWVPFMWIMYDFPGAKVFEGNKRRISMPHIITTQTEGITFSKGNEVFISSESTKIGKQSLYKVDLNKWLGKKSVKTQKPFSITKVEVKSVNGIKVYLKGFSGAKYSVELLDTTGKKLTVKHVKLKNKHGKTYMVVKTRKMNKGVYFVKVTAGKSTFVKRFGVE